MKKVSDFDEKLFLFIISRFLWFFILYLTFLQKQKNTLPEMAMTMELFS